MMKIGDSNAPAQIFHEEEYVLVSDDEVQAIKEQQANERINSIAKAILIPITFMLLGPAQTAARVFVGGVTAYGLSEAIDHRFPVSTKS